MHARVQDRSDHYSHRDQRCGTDDVHGRFLSLVARSGSRRFSFRERPSGPSRQTKSRNASAVGAPQSATAQQLIRAKQPTTAPIDRWGTGGPVEIAVNAVPDPFYKSCICWSFMARGPSFAAWIVVPGTPWRNPDCRVAIRTAVTRSGRTPPARRVRGPGRSPCESRAQAHGHVRAARTAALETGGLGARRRGPAPSPPRSGPALRAPPPPAPDRRRPRAFPVESVASPTLRV